MALIPRPCPDRSPTTRTRVESMPCALSTKTKPDSRGLDPAISEAPQDRRSSRAMMRKESSERNSEAARLPPARRQRHREQRLPAKSFGRETRLLHRCLGVEQRRQLGPQPGFAPAPQLPPETVLMLEED